MKMMNRGFTVLQDKIKYKAVGIKLSPSQVVPKGEEIATI
jgi:hypothetical protein